MIFIRCIQFLHATQINNCINVCYIIHYIKYNSDELKGAVDLHHNIGCANQHAGLHGGYKFVIMKRTDIKISYDQVKQLFNKYNLGTVRSEPMALSGGFCHHVYRVEADCKFYVLKVLNPHIICSDAEINRIESAERIAQRASHMINAVAAQQFNGKQMIHWEGYWIFAYEYIDGSHIFQNDITLSHCRRIAHDLAALHSIAFEPQLICEGESVHRDIDFRYYLELGRQRNMPWVQRLACNIGRIESLLIKCRMLRIWKTISLCSIRNAAS